MTHKQEVAVVLPSSARCSLSARVQAKRRGHTAKAKKNSIRSLTCSSREKTRSAEGKVKVEVEELVAGSPPPSWRTPMATGYPTTTTGMCLAPPGLPALGASARTRRWSSCSTPSTRRPRRLKALLTLRTRKRLKTSCTQSRVLRARHEGFDKVSSASFEAFFRRCQKRKLSASFLK